MKKEKQYDHTRMVFSRTYRNKNKKILNPKSLKQIARDNIRLDDEQLNEESAIKMINFYYFTDRNLKIGFKNNLDSHHFNHANFKLTITPNYPEFGIEVRYNNKILKELSNIYARLTSQYKFKHQTVSSKI